ncbi:MAG: DnaB-like helicase C-terminal domain-containing protein [Verrucomicrobiota bacterium]
MSEDVSEDGRIAGSVSVTAQTVPQTDEERRAAALLDLDAKAPDAAATLAGARDRLLARARGEEKPAPLPWPSLAEAFGGGLWPGLTVLVGGTGTGKTQLALEVALHAAKRGCPVLYVGLELEARGVSSRLAALLDPDRRVHWSDLYLGTMTPGDAAEVLDRAEAELKGVPLRLEFAPPYGWSYDLLRERVRALATRHADLLGGPPRLPPLVVLDFLQLVSGPRDAEGRPLPGTERQDLRERIQQAAYAARASAMEHDAAVLLLSSTARTNYGALTLNGGHKDAPKDEDLERIDPERWLGTGKESGEVEYGADALAVLLTERVPEGAKPPKGKPLHVLVAKVRAGKPSHVELRFVGGTRFAEPDSDERVWRQARADKAALPPRTGKGSEKGKAEAEAERTMFEHANKVLV